MRKIVIIIIGLLSVCELSFPCTTAIISGRYTKDGRPLIFKHRDTGNYNNKVMFINGEIYNYLAVVNSTDIKGDTVWMGTNSAGFSIMNNASYNISDDDDLYPSDNEGLIMKRALEICATLEDFEQLLDTLHKPLYVGANFGVIDSHGGAAYYETENWGYTKFDANDPKVAPFGYIIRTNYSFAGARDEGHGYIRYMTTSKLFYEAEAMHNINERFILEDVDRCLINSLMDVDYSKNIPEDEKSKFVPGADLTMRYYSASTFLCKGVKEGENPNLNTMWVRLGYQLSAPAIPLWISSANDFPEILKGNESGYAPLCSAALKLKDKIYPVKRGHGIDYINLSAVMNKKGTGIYQKVKPIDDSIYSKANEVIRGFYKDGFDNDAALDFYKWVDEFVKKEYQNKFNLNL
jgi:hypothetical protein